MNTTRRDRRKTGRIWKKDPPLRLYADLETYTTSEPEYAYAYGAGWCTELGKFYHNFSKGCIKEFLNWVNTKKGEVLIYFYNLSYDLPFIIDELCKSFPWAEYEFNFTYEKVYIGGYLKLKSCKVIFACAYLWNRTFSLRRWGETLGDEKGQLEDIVKYDMNDDLSYKDSGGSKQEFKYFKELKYLKQDVELLRKVCGAIKLQKSGIEDCCKSKIQLVHESKNIYSPSCPKFSLDAMEAYMKEPIEKIFRFPVGSEEYSRMFRGVTGGFTAGNEEHYILEGNNLVCYDINSSYGYIMSNPLPAFTPIDEIEKGKENEYCKWYVIKGTYCNWLDKYSYIDNAPLGNSFEFLDGKSEFYILGEFYDRIIAKRTVNDIQILRTKFQELYKKHTGYFKRLTATKQSLEPLKSNKEMDMKLRGVKLSIVACYGKLIERVHSEKYVNSNVTRGMKLVTNEFDEFPCILTGLYIAQIARTHLLDAIFTEIDAGNIFLYTDTDSIIMQEKKKTSLKLNDNKLGYWKEELRGNEFRYYGKPKKYALIKHDGEKVLGLKFAISGISLKKEISRWSLKDLRTLYDENNNILFKQGKSINKGVGPNMVTIIRKIDIESNPYRSGKKIKTNKIPITHIYDTEGLREVEQEGKE